MTTMYSRSSRRYGRRVKVTAAAAVAGVLAACSGGGSGDGRELDVYNWGSADEARIYDGIFDEFAASREGVSVENNVVPVTMWGDYVSTLATQIAGGDSPDLLNMGMEGTRLSVEQGLFAPLDERLPDSEIEALMADVPEPLLEAYTIGGKLYSIPNGWQTMVIYANTEMFEEAGVPIPDPDWTWDDFLDIAQQLTEGEVKGFGLPWGFFQLQPWIISNGGYAVTEDYEAPNLTDPSVIEAVTFVRDLVQVHGVAPDPTSVDVYSQFASGRFAMVGAGRWPIPGWNESGFESYVALPWPTNTDTPTRTVFGGAGWALSSQSENHELAWEAIADLVDPEAITELADLGQQLPIYPSVSSSENEAAANAVAVLEEQIFTARPVPAPAFYDTLESVTMRHLQEIVHGEIGVEEGLEAAQAEIEAQLR